jgi:D-alanyl-lipoteichoic acid acyltransferase DltB (MBOAT superfamily)
MLFNSLGFFVFFPLVTTLYFLTPHRYRWIVLLAASCYFYMSFIPVYIFILAVTIVIDYAAGILIEDAGGKTRKFCLLGSIVATCLVLFIFKYYNFFRDNILALTALLGVPTGFRTLDLLLPIGLSFHTFQSLSYVIEVYRGHQRAERHFGIYALYVMFYPQLVAGPIERPQNLLHQFREKHEFVYERARDGLRLMLWGMFKKVVVADRLSIYVDAVYRHVEHHSGATLAVATIFFAFQIYCDFSGYSDIAIGCAKVMGFDLMQNFATPYFSRDIAEFWRRWHISLSTWFRDYVYFPLGGNRVSRPRWYGNLLITFVISGLWHGANWTYIVWGGLNGLYLIGADVLAPARARAAALLHLGKWPRWHGALDVASTFFLTCLAWVFFRSRSVSDAWLALTKMAWDRGPLYVGGARDLIYGTAGIAIVLIVDYWTGRSRFDEMLSTRSLPMRWATYCALAMMLLAIGVFDAAQFIYFQF